MFILNHYLSSEINKLINIITYSNITLHLLRKHTEIIVNNITDNLHVITKNILVEFVEISQHSEGFINLRISSV